jgi:hypothetical protein
MPYRLSTRSVFCQPSMSLFKNERADSEGGGATYFAAREAHPWRVRGADLVEGTRLERAIC